MLVAACGGEGAAGPPPASAPSSRGNPAAEDGLLASQLSLGLEVALEDPEEDRSRYRLTAVVVDGEGNRRTRDLGTHLGEVTEASPETGELLRVLLSGEEGEEVIRFVPGEGGVEALRGPLGAEPGEEELLMLIETPEGADLEAADPGVERL